MKVKLSNESGSVRLPNYWPPCSNMAAAFITLVKFEENKCHKFAKMSSRQPKISILTISDVFFSILGSEIYTICYFEKCCISVQPKNMEREMWTILKACKGVWGQKRFPLFRRKKFVQVSGETRFPKANEVGEAGGRGGGGDERSCTLMCDQAFRSIHEQCLCL